MLLDGIYCGSRSMPDTPAESFLMQAGKTVTIGCVGEFTAGAMEHLAEKMMQARREGAQNLVLELASRSGELKAMEPVYAAFCELQHRLNLIARLWLGCGPAFYIAQACQTVLATPTAWVGHWGVSCDVICEEDREGLQLINDLYGEIFFRKRLTSWKSLQRLEYHAVVAEQAEAMGVIDGISSDRFIFT